MRPGGGKAPMSRRCGRMNSDPTNRSDAKGADPRGDGGQGVAMGGSPLAELLAYMASQKPADEAPCGDEDAATSHPASQAKGPAEPAHLDYFRKLWAGVNAGRQLRQSREQVPDNAGPLNSSHLVHRSLSLMRGLSPGYLQHFLGHLEALSWMERLAHGADAGKEPPRPGGGRKGGRAR